MKDERGVGGWGGGGAVHLRPIQRAGGVVGGAVRFRPIQRAGGGGGGGCCPLSADSTIGGGGGGVDRVVHVHVGRSDGGLRVSAI